MKPDLKAISELAQTAAAEGRYTAALAHKMEYLRQLADYFMAAMDMRVVEALPPDDEPPYSMAEIYANAAQAIATEMQNRGDASPPGLFVVWKIYLTLGNLLSELAYPGPVDGERIAKLLLIGSDVGVVGGLGTIEEEIDRAILAEAQLATKAKQSAAATATSASRASWHKDAFVAHATYLLFNPGKQQFVKRAVASFVEQRTGKPFDKDAGLAKALQRKATEYSEIERVIADAAAAGSADDAPQDMRDAVAAALAAFGPHSKH